MLKVLAKRMYEKGVSHEELLLQKYTAFTPRNVDGKPAAAVKPKKTTKVEQEKMRDSVYTSTEMRKLWTQLFLYDPENGYHGKMLRANKPDKTFQTEARAALTERSSKRRRDVLISNVEEDEDAEVSHQ